MTTFSIILLILVIERVICILAVKNKCRKLEIDGDLYLPSMLLGFIGYLHSLSILKLVERWRAGDKDIFIQPKEDEFPDNEIWYNAFTQYGGGNQNLSALHNTGCLIADINKSTNAFYLKHCGCIYDHSLSSEDSEENLIRTPYNYEAFLETYAVRIRWFRMKYSPAKYTRLLGKTDYERFKGLLALIIIFGTLLSGIAENLYQIHQGWVEVESETLGYGEYYTINSYTYYNSRRYDRWYVYNKETHKWEYEQLLTMAAGKIEAGLIEPIEWERVSKTPPPEARVIKKDK